jgi:uncharacterized protein (TIGR00251 family)
MSEREYHLHDGKSGAAITVRVTPRSSKNEISEILDDGTVKVRLTSPPAEGKANQALIEFLAGVLEIKLSQVEIVAGFAGKDKLVAITNMDSNAVHEKILQNLA